MTAQVVPGGAIAVRNGRKTKKRRRITGPVTPRVQPPDLCRRSGAIPQKVDKAPQGVN